jgi:Spy/CpxP family protein refolding chaperone
VRDLHLTEEQARQIRTTLREQRSPLIDLRAAVEKAEGEVEDLFNEDTIDSKKAASAIDELVQARTRLMRAYAGVSLKLRAVLTSHQWRELQRRRPQPGRQPQALQAAPAQAPPPPQPPQPPQALPVAPGQAPAAPQPPPPPARRPGQPNASPFDDFQ